MRLSRLTGDRRLWIGLGFGVLLLLGLATAPDYGVSIDEYTNHFFGVRWYDYAREVLVDGAPIGPLATATEHDIVHGPFFEMILAAIEREVLQLGIFDLPQVVAFRHAVTWTVFVFSVAGVCALARKLQLSRPFALLAGLFLVLQPRLYAHAFFNSVDIPFLACYTAGLLTLVRYRERRTFGALLLHAAVCAWAIDIRLIGGVLPALTLVVLAVRTWNRRRDGPDLRSALAHLVLFPAVVATVTVLCWPYLWNDPLARMLEVVRLTPDVGWNGFVLFGGREMPATELPWYYLPVYIAITTPIVCTLCCGLGLIGLLINTVRTPRAKLGDQANAWIVAAAFLLPLGAVIGLRGVVYDDWRHLYFISPAFVLIAALGVRQVVHGLSHFVPPARLRWARSIGGALLGCSLLPAVWFMVRSHPYQHVYFNRLAGPDLATISRRYEMDYWGLSYRRALEHLVEIRPTGPLRIYHGDNAMLAINRALLPPADNERIAEVGFTDAEFVFTNYRQARNGFPELEEIYSVTVDDAKLLTIYRRPVSGK